MRIACVTAAYWPAFSYGGTVISTHLLNRALVSLGETVEVYTTAAGLPQDASAPAESALEGVLVRRFPHGRFFDAIGQSGWQYSPALTGALAGSLNTYDLVYLVGIWNYPIAAAAAVCRRGRVPYVLSPRGHLYPYAVGKKRVKKGLYLRFFAPALLSAAAALHYTSEDEARQSHAHFGLRNRYFVVPNGLDFGAFSPLPAASQLRQRYPQLGQRKTILYMGRLNWKKGLPRLIEATCVLVREGLDVHLLLAGQDEAGYGRFLQRCVARHGLSERVTFMGLVREEAQLQAYAGSDVFVLPSDSENFGMAVIEAMACGLPVIVTDRVALHEELSRHGCGIVVEPTVSSLAEGMRAFFADGQQRQRLSENARAFVRARYDIAAVAEAMRAQFREVAHGR